ncbi:E3 ubiquitin-protein ligase goliath isoform X1 [Maniola hyperantus]|uniref:E3 ubiquitin-protein ligase goliath isoform X1 n=1 Tax=Aphantopus hyperantus TaxID=2795564 RepID=UPI001568BCB5|nr:protein goliath isoform X1 [Maniola hyperantus]
MCNIINILRVCACVVLFKSSDIECAFKMRVEDLWSGLAALGWFVSIVGCHTPGSELESVRYGPSEERFGSDTYTVASINITYKDEHGEVYTETSESGKYGEGYIGSSRGMAVHVRGKGPDGERDHTGCTWPLLSAAAPTEPLPREPWIAVIRRGSCNFEIKVQNAWRANASAVLIYNDRDTTVLEKMKLSTDNGRNISAVFTYRWKGEEITRLVDNGTRVMIGVIKGRTYTHINSNINNASEAGTIYSTSVLFVSISFIVLMVISLAWLVFYYIQRFRYIHAKDRMSKRLCCAAKKALSKIPVKSLKTDDREVQGDGECCAICIEPYKVSETLRSLPCRHDFHKNCIDPWLLEHRTCPMCKMDILKYYGFVFTGSQESILQLEVEEARTSLSPGRNRHPLTLLTSDNSYEEASSERSSRAASPDHLVPARTDPPPDRSCGGSPTHSQRDECSREDAASVSSRSSPHD